MGRKNRAGHWPRGEYLRADREERGGRVLKAWRRVDEDHTALIGGALMELAHSEDIPPIKLTTKLDAFIFDPRLMPRNFNDGFLPGYQFGRVLADIEHSGKISDVGYKARLGRMSLLPNGRTVLVEVDSERLRAERTAIYGILGSAGVKGFTIDGHRKQHHSPGNPTIALGNFSQPIAKNDRQSALEAIGIGVEHNLISGNEGMDIVLGRLEVKAYQPG